MKTVKVYYQKDFNPFAKYSANRMSKTHVKVYEGLVDENTNEENIFRTFNSDAENPLSYTNKTNKVCIIDKDTLGTGADFQKAMREDKLECGHTSMSVGDIVAINSTYYLCEDMGWKVIK
jgi:hypothetical protein